MLGNDLGDVGGLTLAQHDDLALAVTAGLRLIEARDEIADRGNLLGSSCDQKRAARRRCDDGGCAGSARGGRRAFIEKLLQGRGEFNRTSEFNGNHRALPAFLHERLGQRVKQRLDFGVLRISRAHHQLARTDNGNNPRARRVLRGFPRTRLPLADGVAHQSCDLVDIAVLHFVNAHHAHIAFSRCNIHRGDEVGCKGKAISATRNHNAVATLVGAHAHHAFSTIVSAHRCEQLLERRCCLGCARELQRIHLEIKRFRCVWGIEALHQFGDFIEIIFVGGHEQRRTAHIGNDRHRALLPAAATTDGDGGAIIEELLQRRCNTLSIGALEPDLLDGKLSGRAAIDLGDHLGDLRARIGVCAQKKNSRRIVSDNLRMLAQCGICAKHDLLDGRKNIGRPAVADDDGFQRCAGNRTRRIEHGKKPLDLPIHLRPAGDHHHVGALVRGKLGHADHDSLRAERTAARGKRGLQALHHINGLRMLDRHEPKFRHGRTIAAIGECYETVGERYRLGCTDNGHCVGAALSEDAHRCWIERKRIAISIATSIGAILRDRDGERPHLRPAVLRKNRTQRFSHPIGASVAQHETLDHDLLRLLSARECGDQLANRLEVTIARNHDQ